MHHAYKLYATAPGIASKSECVQCCAFLQVAGFEAQKVHRSFKFESSEKDKYVPLVEAFQGYCEGKENVTVIRFRFNTYKQTNENMECFIRELKSWISACEYGDLEDSTLRDQLICGV